MKSLSGLSSYVSKLIFVGNKIEFGWVAGRCLGTNFSINKQKKQRTFSSRADHDDVDVSDAASRDKCLCSVDNVRVAILTS